MSCPRQPRPPVYKVRSHEVSFADMRRAEDKCYGKAAERSPRQKTGKPRRGKDGQT